MKDHINNNWDWDDDQPELWGKKTPVPGWENQSMLQVSHYRSAVQEQYSSCMRMEKCLIQRIHVYMHFLPSFLFHT